MSVPFFSEAWANVWKEKLNASDAYHTAAANWEWPLVVVFKADPDLGIDEDIGIYLDLYHGECREARLATPQDQEKVPYVISADAYTWKQILNRELDPIMGIMQGKMKLEKGDMATLAGYVLAAKELVNTALEIETSFPEGW
ncbi:MAG: SCP2 sterol-binding domain-containing protein [Firmicutes bacterium]|nr:SCP2 sterol-binding domain-containing protein [Bacillota bacterium]